MTARILRISLFVALGLWCAGTFGCVAVDSQPSHASAVSLDGPWQFTTDPSALSRPDAVWDTIAVPGNWDTQPAYAKYKGNGWYRRQFTVPPRWSGRHVRIVFGAVYQKATVWLNGEKLGVHEGGYTPFEFDLTDHLKQDAPNTLLIEANNTYRRGAWWSWGGISRDVTLQASDDARLVWQHIGAEPDLASKEADVSVSWKVANQSEKPLAISIASQIDGVADPALSASATIPAKSEMIVQAHCKIAKDRLRLWDFDHPNLYTLTSSLSIADMVVDRRTDRFGIRKIEVTPDGLLLNGERVRLCGFNRVFDSNEAGNTEPDELVRHDVDLMKSAGAGMSRLMHYPQAPNLLDYLDQKGMLIFCEIPVWGGGDPHMKPDDPLPRQWMREMIERDYNHPCIIGWSMGNELDHHDAYVRSMLTFTRNDLDASRLLTYVSNSGVRKEYNPGNDPISASDILLHNSYVSAPGKTAEILRAKWPNLPIFFSEFGIRQIGAASDAKIPGLDKMMAAVAAHPYVIGVSIWTFNDYRSGFKGTPPSGNREWGVVDVNRRPKAAYAQVRALFSPVHSITISSGVVRIEPRSVDEIPSYPLRGYKLKWTGGEMDVPELKPGDAAWSASITLPPGAPTPTVSLIAPTGYDVADATAQPPVHDDASIGSAANLPSLRSK